MILRIRKPVAHIVCVLAALWAQAAHGAEDVQLGIGVAAGAMRKPYRDVGDEAIAFPLLSYENRWVRIGGPGVELKLAGNGTFDAVLRARYDNDGYKAKDSAHLAGMRERKGSAWVGPALSWRLDSTTLSFEWLSDASRHSKGTQASVSLEKRFQYGRWGLVPRIGVTFRNAKTMNYYFGVDASEARTWRRAYTAGSSNGTDIGVRLTYDLNATSVLMLDAGLSKLGDAVKSSPLTESSRQSHLVVGYLYNF
jgi:outer membrane scaffolding protein for murein synthesis (MipA/OmpV family)